MEAALLANETVNGTFTQAALAMLESNSSAADVCRPRYFIFNSQVTGRRQSCLLERSVEKGLKRNFMPGDLKISRKRN